MADRRRHQAVHEAGHAVIGSSLGLKVDEVGFNAPSDKSDSIDFAASTRFVDGEPCELIRSSPDTMAIVMFAGAVSESVILGETLPNSHQFDVAALELCYPDLPKDPKPIFDPAVRKALALAEEHRHEIEAVAERLLADDRLGGDEVEAIIRATRDQRSQA